MSGNDITLCDWCRQPSDIPARVLQALRNLISAIEHEADGEFGIGWLVADSLQDAKTAYAAAIEQQQKPPGPPTPSRLHGDWMLPEPPRATDV